MPLKDAGAVLTYTAMSVRVVFIQITTRDCGSNDGEDVYYSQLFWLRFV